MGQVVLRPGTPADLDAMFQLDCLCFGPPFRFTRGAMARYARQPGAFITVAECEGRLIAFLIVQVELSADGAEAYLVTLDVDPAYRRLGIAGRLMAAAEAEAAERSASRLLLHVWSENDEATAFYRHRQYQLIGREPGYYGKGREALILSRQLE